MNLRTNENNELINKNVKKEYNLGIEILRVFLSFMVVLDHLYNKKKLKKYYYILYYHIPSFFLISFFFTYNTLTSFNLQKIKLRFERLIIPYIGWSIMAFILKNIYYYLFNLNYTHNLKGLVKHLITGHVLNIPLWYQAILMFTTIFFLIIIFIFRNNILLAFHILSLISYILQYSGLNYYLIKKYLTNHAKLTFGRFMEALPNAITGYTFAYLKIIYLLRQYRAKAIFFSFAILVIISKYAVFENLKTFKYGGLRLNIASSCLFIIFSLLPLKNINNILKAFINYCTRYTAGVYYMHYLVGNTFLIKTILKSLNGTIYGCIIVYLLCYSISYFGIKILGKNKLKYMFL